MKFDNIEQLKEFLLWAKKNHIEAISVAGIEARFSAYSFVPGLAPDSEPDPEVPTYQANKKTWDEVDESREDDDELLYWSAVKS